MFKVTITPDKVYAEEVGINDDIDKGIGSWYWAKSVMYQGCKAYNPEVHNDGSRMYCYYDSEYNAFTSVRTNGEESVYRYNDEDKHPAVPYGWEIYKEE